MPIRIMNWNIQNLGRDKALAGDTGDLLKNIARVVVDNNIDIFIVLEVNTTIDETALEVAGNLRAELRRAASFKEGMPATAYQHYIISPKTGREFYAFFIKDTAAVVPLTITGGVPDKAQNPASVAFKTFTGSTDLNNDKDYFPLIEPDLKSDDKFRQPKNWTATRLPCLALFKVKIGAPAANQALAIVCCHFAPNSPQASDQIHAVNYISLLSRATGEVGIVPLRAQINAAPVPIVKVILTGDFNLHYPSFLDPDPYRYLTNKVAGVIPKGMEYTAKITDRTHLITLYEFNRLSRPKETEIRSACYDNFFVNQGLASTTLGSVVDVPRLVKSKRILFNESLDKYAGQDVGPIRRNPRKGIENKPYARSSYQALRLGNTPTLKDMLTGARLISDHLPVIIEIA